MTESSIRSIKRSFAVFEMFDVARTPMSATDIARKLGTPLSSTLELLKSISAMGYITYDSRARTYFPSLRISLLGSWIQTSLLGDMALLPMLDEVQAATSETVSISAINDLEMQFLWVARGRQAIALNIEEGQTLPILTTSVGQALIARWTMAEIKAFVKRFNRWQPDQLPINEADALSAAAAVRERGYAAVYDKATVGVGSIAVAIPLAYDRNLVLSVGGPTERIRSSEANIAATIQRVTSKHNHDLPEETATLQNALN